MAPIWTHSWTSDVVRKDAGVACPMPNYQFKLLPPSALTFTSADQPDPVNEGHGAGWSYESFTFTVDRTEAMNVAVSDDDGVLQDDPTNPEWSGGSWAPQNQTLAAPLTVDGTTWPAGTIIEDEYEFDALGSDGVTYRVVAISMTDPDTMTSTVVGYTFDGDWPGDGVTLTSQPGSNEDGQSMAPPATICLCSGTLIETEAGPRAIERLTAGDRLLTPDGHLAEVAWVGHRTLSAAMLDSRPSLRPIRIARGALGHGLPRRDLLVSPQHRILVRSRIVARMQQGQDSTLVAAHHLLGRPGVETDLSDRPVTYWHVLCHRHELMLAEGAPVETLLPGREALRTLGVFGSLQLRDTLARDTAMPRPEPVVPIMPGHQARRLLRRHLAHRRELV